MIIGLLFMSVATLFAQDAGAASTSDSISTETILTYSLLLIIALEIVAIVALLRWHRFFTGIEGMEEAKLESLKSTNSFNNWWNSINKFKSIENEDDIDMGHSYDGIRELNNVLPPWFTWTFIASIVFGFGYLWKYHWSSNPAPNQYQAYEKEVAAAKIKQDAYLKSRGDLVNETNVKMVDAAGVEAGKKLFSSNCAVCHSDKGQGGVGPNLTDDFWLHGGNINDIFKTIKYGVVEKGMQSWKDVFSPDQIADLSSYIITLHGTNPPGAKEPQGELFNGDATGGATGSADSATAKAGDSTAAKK
ncbi:MAG: c-type cytochrome [Sphingobacteriales bacterium]|nr:c-type cytochrome [Sphingobacteriales bacterium]